MTVSTETREPKRYTPEAEIALETHIQNLRTSVRLAAQRLSSHEEILRDDVHQAIAELAAPRGKVSTISDWLKWVGFFVLGLVVPTTITVFGTEKPDKGLMIFLVVSIFVAAAAIAASLVLDLGMRRHSKKKRLD